MSLETKHREISRQLLGEIASGKYGPDGCLPSEAQLVKRFQVSRPTVGRALRDLQAEGLIERRAGSGTYVRRQASTAPNTRQLGLLIPGLGTVEIFGIICGELASLARAHEYTLLWGDSTHPAQGQDVSREHAIRLCEQFVAIIAYRAMLERIAEPTLPARSLLLTPRLVVRESCGAYLPHKTK